MTNIQNLLASLREHFETSKISAAELSHNRYTIWVDKEGETTRYCAVDVGSDADETAIIERTIMMLEEYV